MDAPTPVREQQRQLWEELARQLERAQADLLGHDLCSFEECTARQRRCCKQLAAMGQDEAARGNQPPAKLDEALAGVRRRVRHLSRVQEALLRRALQSLRILRNLAAASSPNPEGNRESFREEG
jgi:hypothetical protein